MATMVTYRIYAAVFAAVAVSALVATFVLYAMYRHEVVIAAGMIVSLICGVVAGRVMSSRFKDGTDWERSLLVATCDGVTAVGAAIIVVIVLLIFV